MPAKSACCIPKHAIRQKITPVLPAPGRKSFQELCKDLLILSMITKFFLKKVFSLMVPTYHKILFFEDNLAKHIIQIIAQLKTVSLALQHKVMSLQQKACTEKEAVQRLLTASIAFYFEYVLI